MIRGDAVLFTPDKRGTAKRRGIIESIPPLTGEAMVKLEGDPFAVKVKLSQLTCIRKGKAVPLSAHQHEGNPARAGKETQMSSTSKPSGKQLREDAQALGIKGWEEMGKKELAKAVAAKQAENDKPAAKVKPKTAPKKAASKPTPAKKAAPKSKAPAAPKTAKTKPKADVRKDGAPRQKPGPKPREVAPGENPYRKGTGLHACFGILKVGGKRRTMAEKLAKKATIHPHSRAGATKPEDYDKRLILASQDLEKRFGWVVVRNGRGLDGTLKLLPPGSTAPQAKKVAPVKKTATAKKAPAKKVAASKKAAPVKKTAAKKAAPKKAAAKK